MIADRSPQVTGRQCGSGYRINGPLSDMARYAQTARAHLARDLSRSRRDQLVALYLPQPNRLPTQTSNAWAAA